MSRTTNAELIAENDELRRQIADSQTVDQKQAEQELRIAEANYRRLYQSMRDGFVRVDMDGRVREYNEAYRQMLGYEPEELLTFTYIDLTPPRWHAIQAEVIQSQVLARGYSDLYEKEYRRKDGTIFPVELRTELLRNEKGEPSGMWAIVRDITDRKRAEEAARRAQEDLEKAVSARTAELRKTSEELQIFHRFAEAAGQGFGMADMDGRITYMNPALCRLAGVGSPEDALGQHLSRYYPEGYMQLRDTQILPALFEKGHWEGELAVSRAPTTHILQHSFLIRDEQGNPSRLASVITDISQRKQAEEALRKSEERYDLATRGAGVGLWDYDLRTGHVYYSPRWKALFGYGPDEIGESLDDWIRLLHPEERDWIIGFQNDFLAGTETTVTAEYRLRHRDGSYRWIKADGVCLRDAQGRASRFVGSHEDISDRKQAEQALLQSHEELRSIYDGMTDGLLVADAETRRFVRCNQAICQMLGYSEDELLSRSVMDIHPTTEAANVLDRFQELIFGRLQVVPEIPVLRKDGSVFYADVSHNEFTCGGRRLTAGFFRDITERKRSQEALERERQSLWRMLQASDHERRLISYEIHDGLAQCLAGAIMQFQSYEQAAGRAGAQATKTFAGAMELLHQSHAEARRLISGVRPPILDEWGVVAAIDHLTHDQRYQNGPTITFQSSVQFERLAPIQENVIYRIIQESLANAVQHSHSPAVVIRLCQQKDWLRVEVRDWGVGFLQEQAADRYGLEGIRQRARLLGGRATINSAPGAGTQIVVELPIVPHTPQSHAHLPPLADSQANVPTGQANR